MGFSVRARPGAERTLIGMCVRRPGHVTWAPGSAYTNDLVRGPGFAQLGLRRTLERLVLWSTPVNPTDEAPHWNRTSPPDEYADFTKEYDLQHERITLPTILNTK